MRRLVGAGSSAGALALVSLALLVAGFSIACSQETTMQDLQRAFARDTTITLSKSGVELRSAGFDFDGRLVEAILVRPVAVDRSPAVLMIPGYSRSAVDQIPMAVALAKRGYVCLAVTQPGFGRSAGEPDFAGPRSVGAALEAYRRLAAESFVDGARTAVFGYSRGAMVAALAAARLPRLRGAVLGGGVYDLGAAYREVDREGIRRNIENEAGSDSTAWRARSALFVADRIECPVLILHGEKDENASVAQARGMHEALTRLGKESELVVIEGAGHGLPPAIVLEHTLDFLSRRMGVSGGK